MFGGPPFNKDILEFTLKDSRGLESDKKILSEANGDFVLVPYILPTLNVNIQRVAPTSNSILVSFSGNSYNGYFNESQTIFNTLNIAWRYKEKNGNWNTQGADDEYGWRYLTEGTDYEYVQNENQYQSIGSLTISNLFNYQKDYVVEIKVKDRANSKVSVLTNITKGIPYFDYGIDSNGENYFCINGKLAGMNVITGTELATNEYVDNNKVFRTRFDFGYLPNATTKTISTGLSANNITIVKPVFGFATGTSGNINYLLTLPDISPSNPTAATRLTMDTNNNIWEIKIETGVNRSNYYGYIDLYYIKNS